MRNLDQVIEEGNSKQKGPHLLECETISLLVILGKLAGASGVKWAVNRDEATLAVKSG